MIFIGKFIITKITIFMMLNGTPLISLAVLVVLELVWMKKRQISLHQMDILHANVLPEVIWIFFRQSFNFIKTLFEGSFSFDGLLIEFLNPLKRENVCVKTSINSDIMKKEKNGNVIAKVVLMMDMEIVIVQTINIGTPRRRFRGTWWHPMQKSSRF